MADRRRPSRRAVLGGLVALPVGVLAAAGTGVDVGLLPGRARVREALRIGRVEVAAPAAHAPEPVYRIFDSTARGRAVTWGVCPSTASPSGAGRWAASGLLVARQASRGALDAPGRLVADFARWGALAARPGTAGIALSASCGVDDPFCAQVRRYRAAAHPTPAGGIGDGQHDAGYWRSLLPTQLAFLDEHLR